MKRSILGLCLLGLLAAAPAAGVQTARKHPSLVVVLVVDQMRADYLVRYGSLFEHGLMRLMSHGAWYQNASYPYLNTFTCVGHTTIGTGTLPYHHGIIDNTWYDRQQQKTVACTQDPSTREVAYGRYTGIGESARNTRTPALAEVMRRATHARTAGVSLKARAAISLVGHSADAVTWFDDRGEWETSSAFAQAPLPWLSTFVEHHPVTVDADKVWERMLPVNRYQGEDDAPGERGSAGWSRTFPHPLGAASAQGFYLHWETSPYSDAALEQIAESTIDALKLGQRKTAATDFLGVSFSALDYVGHAFGPSSQEVQDLLVHLDSTIGRLLDHLDAQVGADNYLLVLTADHGVADVAEQRPGGGRIRAASITNAINTALAPLLGEGPFAAATIECDVYFKPGMYDRLRKNPAAMQKALDAVQALPGVARVLRGEQLRSSAARRSTDHAIRAAALSYFPGRSGDLVIVPKEYWEITPNAASHGSLYPYDQDVPLLFYGAGVPPGIHHEPASPADIAPTLAAIVGVHLPAPDGHRLPVLERARQ
jgi:predicted AlkP superfamily pyrophosphatase or phosphodiesterase